MTLMLLPALFALFIWWFSTGAVIYLDGGPRRSFPAIMLASTVLFAAALYVLAASARWASVSGAYAAFTAAILIWAWQEVSFYLGYVTGPRKAHCPEGCAGWRHFGHALGVSLYHELAILASAGAVLGLTWGEPNQIGTWTFLVLWWMHESARINVFLGVRNVSEEFLPAHLDILKSFLVRKPMNLLFPVSVTLSTVAGFVLFQRAWQSDTAFAATGYTLVGAMMALAVLEHWVLMLPLPFAALWSWSVRPAPAATAPACAHAEPEPGAPCPRPHFDHAALGARRSLPVAPVAASVAP